MLLFIADSYFTLSNFFILDVMYFLDFRGKIVFLFLYSKCTNYVDPDIIITLFLIFCLYSIFLLTDRFVFSVFDSPY
jgi:hypothetical protein